MNDARIPPFGRDFDEAMERAGASPSSDSIIKMARRGADRGVAGGVSASSPIHRLQDALDRLMNSRRQLMSTADSLVGPPVPASIAASDKATKSAPLPDGFFNQVMALAQDFHNEAGHLDDQIARIEAARDGR